MCCSVANHVTYQLTVELCKLNNSIESFRLLIVLFFEQPMLELTIRYAAIDDEIDSTATIYYLLVDYSKLHSS